MSCKWLRTIATRAAPALLLWTAGCAGAQGSGREAGTRFGGVRGCAEEEWSSELPSVETLVDRPALTAGVREVRDGFTVDSGRVTLTMWYEADGRNARREVVQESVGAAVADTVQELVFQALLPVPEQEAPWGVRLEVALGPEITYRVSRRERCPPRPRDIEMARAIRRLPFRGTGLRTRTVLLEVLIHPRGYVLDAEVIRGVGGGLRMEQALLDFMRQYSFEPARVDGIPVVGRLVVPVRVRN